MAAERNRRPKQNENKSGGHLLTGRGISSYFLPMPDTGGRRKRYARGWTLSNAHDTGQLVRVYCGICCKKRWFLPSDLKQLMGDIEADDIPRHMRCDLGHDQDFLQVEFQYLTAHER